MLMDFESFFLFFLIFFFFFFNDTATTEIYTLSLHDALPISGVAGNIITNGVMLFGRDTNQAGLTAGEKLYLSDTAGALSNTSGTYEMLVGQAYDATSEIGRAHV